jgi:pimeloyl-ACP methyl ester carboxylesterase
VLAGSQLGGILAQLLAFRRPGLVAGLVLVDPAHEQMISALPGVARWGLRLAHAGSPDERGGSGDADSQAADRVVLPVAARAAPPGTPAWTYTAIPTVIAALICEGARDE